MKRIILAALLLTGCSTNSTQVTPAAPGVLPSGPLTLGAYVPSGVAAFETSLGEKLSIINHYSNWNWTSLKGEATDIANGSTPMLSWSAGLSPTTCASLSAIVSGTYDAQLKSQAIAVQALKNTIWFRPFYEMTDSPAEGCANPTKSGPLFIAAWQHVVSIFSGAHVTNVKWVWSPGQPAYFSNIELNFYPGPTWVDIVGEDIYNKTPNAEPFSAQVCAVAKQLGKPSAITETGAGPAEQIEWISTIKTGCVGLDYLIYWDAPGVQDYVITDPAVFSALKALQ